MSRNKALAAAPWIYVQFQQPAVGAVVEVYSPAGNHIGGRLHTGGVVVAIHNGHGRFSPQDEPEVLLYGVTSWRPYHIKRGRK